MAATFPRFICLPAELREQVWFEAVREHTTTRGVHFFKVRNVPRITRKNYLSTSDEFPVGLYLTAPGCGAACVIKGCPGRGCDPWRHNNDSAYLHDSGMWMTCKESRYIIRKYRSRDHYLASNGEPAALPVVCRSADDAAVDDSESRHFAVYSRSGLFVLQLNEVTNEMLGCIHIGKPFMSPKLDFRPLGNIAIEFVPRKEQYDEMAFRLASVLYGVDSLHRLYVVDYGCPDKAELRVDSVGKRFRGRGSWYIQGDYCDRTTDCMRFVSKLAIHLDERKKWSHQCTCIGSRWNLCIEVLVCVLDDSRIRIVSDEDEEDSD